MAREPIVLGDGDDEFIGTDNPEHVKGMGGNDAISGGAGNDRLDGGGGNDVLKGGSGNDKIDGGTGDDVVLGGSGNDRIFTAEGNDIADGGAGRDTLVLAADYADTVIVINDDGSATFTTAAGEVNLKNIEFIQFNDRTLAFDDLFGGFPPRNRDPVGASTTSLPDGVRDTPYRISESALLEGFTDPDGDTLSAVDLVATEGATVVDRMNGVFIIHPAAEFVGTVQLHYRVIDRFAGSIDARNQVRFVAVHDLGQP